MRTFFVPFVETPLTQLVMWLVTMVKNKWQWILLALLMACAPFIYANVIGYWVLLITPVGQFFSVAGKTANIVLIMAMNLAGAFVVAVLLSLPLGYAAKNRPFLFGMLLGLSPLFFVLWVNFDNGWSVPTPIKAIRIGEYASILIAFITVARLGAYLREIKERAT